MQNDNVNLKEDVEINLMDILWKILMQWRIVVIFSLLVAVGFVCVKYKKDLTDYNTEVENETEVSKSGTQKKYTEDEIDELKENLSDSELNSVERAVFNQQKILTDQKYLESSLLMQIDSQNEHIVCMDYYLSELEPGFSELLCQAYKSRCSDEEVLENISLAMDVDIEKSNLQKVMGELISVEYSGTTNLSSTVTMEGYEISNYIYPVINVTVILPTNADAEKVKKAINHSMEEISKELNETVGEHKLNLLEGYDRFCVDNNVKNAQNNVQNEILDCESVNTTLLSSFTDEQKSLYRAEVFNIKDQMGINDSEVDESKTEEALEEPQVKPVLSKKYFVVGFVGGLVIYFIFYLFIAALKHKVNYGESVADAVDLRKFGEYHNYDKKGLGKFIWSKHIYKYYYRKYLNLSEVSTYTSNGISTMATLMNNTQKLTLLALDDSSVSALAYIEAVITKLVAGGCDAQLEQCSIQSLLTDASTIKSLEKVILVIRQDKTDYHELDEFLNMAIDYKIPVMGYVFTE